MNILRNVSLETDTAIAKSELELYHKIYNLPNDTKSHCY